MHHTEKALRDALAADRYDWATRCALADWLEEHDRPEEATIHRRWTKEAERKAWEYLEEFSKEFTFKGYDDGHYPSSNLSIEQLIELTLSGDYYNYEGFDTPDIVWTRFFRRRSLRLDGGVDKLREAVAQVTDRRLEEVSSPRFECSC